MTTWDNLDYNTAVALYVHCGKVIDEIKRTTSRQENVWKEKRLKIENWITEHANRDKLKNIKTDSGTAFWTTHHNCSVANPEEFMKYIREKERYDLLEVRASKSAVKNEIDETGGLPPGINFSSRRVFKVTTNKTPGG
jgi:hypothetical protein